MGGPAMLMKDLDEYRREQREVAITQDVLNEVKATLQTVIRQNEDLRATVESRLTTERVELLKLINQQLGVMEGSVRRLEAISRQTPALVEAKLSTMRNETNGSLALLIAITIVNLVLSVVSR